jgi:hypothetical protein
MVLTRGEVSAWTWWCEHRGRNRRVGEQAVFAGVIDPLRVSPGGRDIRVDSLATQLVINRRLAHGANTVEAGLRGRHQHGVYRLCTRCEWAPAMGNPTDPPDQRQ